MNHALRPVSIIALTCVVLILDVSIAKTDFWDAWLVAHFIPPLFYFYLTTGLLLKLRVCAQAIPHSAHNILSVVLITYLLFIAYQVFANVTQSGSLRHSTVEPGVFSGMVPAVLTYLVFFIKTRSTPRSIVACIACILWLLGPMFTDATVIDKWGSTGQWRIASIPVLGGLHWFLTSLFLVAAPLIMLLIPYLAILIVMGACYGRSTALGRVLGWSHDTEKWPIGAYLLSIAVLAIQIANWGFFVPYMLD